MTNILDSLKTITVARNHNNEYLKSLFSVNDSELSQMEIHIVYNGEDFMIEFNYDCENPLFSVYERMDEKQSEKIAKICTELSSTSANL